MSPEQVKQLIGAALPDVAITVSGDGSHFEVRVVGACFEGKSLVQKQKIVYATLNDKITSGEIHAVTIKAYTAEEWEKAQKFQVGSL